MISVERVTQPLQNYAGTAVTASQSELDSLGLANFVDLPALLPGVEISNYEDNTELYVRGIGSNANTELGDPAIAAHLDDVYVPRPRGLGVAFFDLERVEMNVGPQGTVRGRNALGGTINLVSRKPTIGKWDGYVEYAVGDYNHQESRGALNVPISEAAAARLALYTSKHDPFVKNVGPLSGLTGWESQDDIGGRAHLLLQPIGRLSGAVDRRLPALEGHWLPRHRFLQRCDGRHQLQPGKRSARGLHGRFQPHSGHASLGRGAERDLQD